MGKDLLLQQGFTVVGIKPVSDEPDGFGSNGIPAAVVIDEMPPSAKAAQLPALLEIADRSRPGNHQQAVPSLQGGIQPQHGVIRHNRRLGISLPDQPGSLFFFPAGFDPGAANAEKNAVPLQFRFQTVNGFTEVGESLFKMDGQVPEASGFGGKRLTLQRISLRSRFCAAGIDTDQIVLHDSDSFPKSSARLICPPHR